MSPLLAVIPAALTSMSVPTALGAAALVGGAGMQLAAGQQQASATRAQADMQRMNAQAMRAAAENERFVGEAEGARAADEGRRRNATAFNQMAGSGVQVDSGSPVLVMDDLAAGSALDASIARWRGTQAASARNQQAGFMENEARMTDWRARSIDGAKWWQAGSTLLTGGARLMRD